MELKIEHFSWIPKQREKNIYTYVSYKCIEQSVFLLLSLFALKMLSTRMKTKLNIEQGLRAFFNELSYNFQRPICCEIYIMYS